MRKQLVGLIAMLSIVTLSYSLTSTNYIPIDAGMSWGLYDRSIPNKWVGPYATKWVKTPSLTIYQDQSAHVLPFTFSVGDRYEGGPETTETFTVQQCVIAPTVDPSLCYYPKECFSAEVPMTVKLPIQYVNGNYVFNNFNLKARLRIARAPNNNVGEPFSAEVFIPTMADRPSMRFRIISRLNSGSTTVNCGVTPPPPPPPSPTPTSSGSPSR